MHSEESQIDIQHHQNVSRLFVFVLFLFLCSLADHLESRNSDCLAFNYEKSQRMYKKRNSIRSPLKAHNILSKIFTLI